MSDLPGYARAQAQWEAMLPPEDGPSDCPECNGQGWIEDADGHDYALDKCQKCNGFGMVDFNGEPHDPDAKQRAAEERADWKRGDV